MPRIGGHRERSKIGNLWRFNRFIDTRCLAPPTLDGDGDVDALRRMPYRLLPRQDLIDLFVLKLDGSVFGVRVARNGTVAELKREIEEVFVSPGGDEHCKITWSLVWGHFCLCYEGQNLIDDKACIRVFGIKDGDQLQFIRHMSINCLPVKRDRKNQTVSCKTVLLKTYFNRRNATNESKCVEENQLAGPDDPEIYEEIHEDGTNQEKVPMPGFHLANFFRGRLIHSRIWGFLKSASEGRNRPSGFGIT